ncbi:MAG: 1-acyl-sn-glycerol-3-phosphate acyltransferase [Clostridia bacterium]|nr:1-acyl-sn-glycerol-3-phosphate acyltransferase [Clostridia bacterium]
MESDKKNLPQETVHVEVKKDDPTVLAPQKRTFVYSLAVCLMWVFFKLVYFMKFEGRENIEKGKNVVLMGNHQCMLDPICLALCVPDREIHFMGKKELWNNKILGWLFTKVHGFPVDRGNVDMAAIRTAMGILKEGNTLGIFPEGTRSKVGHMLPLLSGASMLGFKSGCDIVPVYIDGNYKPFRRITVRVGKPIDMQQIKKEFSGKTALDEITRRMEASFAQLSGGKSLPPAEGGTEE